MNKCLYVVLFGFSLSLNAMDQKPPLNALQARLARFSAALSERNARINSLSAEGSLESLSLHRSDLKDDADNGLINSLGWKPDDSKIISAVNSTLKLWDVCTQKVEAKIPYSNLTVASWSRDGQNVFVNSDEGPEIVDTRSWKAVKKIGKKIYTFFKVFGALTILK